MSKLWRKDGSAVTIDSPSKAAGGGVSHHSIFEWAGEKELAKAARSTSHANFQPSDFEAVSTIAAAGKPANKNALESKKARLPVSPVLVKRKKN